MDFKFHFLHVDPSKPLTESSQEILSKVAKTLIGDSQWQVTFKKGRVHAQAHISAHTSWGHFQAEAKGESFYQAIEKAAERIGRQLNKQKEKLQRHRGQDRTKQARLKRLNAALELEQNPFSPKRSA